MKIALKDLKPNPFRNFDLYPIFPEWIEQLKDSIKQTGYWNGFCVREHNGEYQIAYGHHRLEAAKQVYGESYEIDVEPEEMTDSMMRARMFRENVRNEAQDSAVILHDIEVAKKFPSDWKGLPMGNHVGEIWKSKPWRQSIYKIAIFIGRGPHSVQRVYQASKELSSNELSDIRPRTAESIVSEIRRQKPSKKARKQIIQEAKEGNVGPKTAKQRVREIIVEDQYGKALVTQIKKKPDIHIAIFKEIEPAADKLKDQLAEVNKFTDFIDFKNINLSNFAVTLEGLDIQIKNFLEVYDEKKGILQDTKERDG